MDYTEREIREQLKRGPDEYDIFRLKVKGDGATKWLNVPQPAIVALADAVGGAERHTFALTLTLGNAAMSTREDVAAVLESCAEAVRTGGDSGRLRDHNGNTVGKWSLTLPPRTCEECGGVEDEPHVGEPCHACGGGADA